VAEVYVCRGRDCRKHSGTRKLTELLDAAGVRWTPVRCQKICKAPVVGVKSDGPVVWYAKVRGREARVKLARLIESGKAKKMKAHRVKKRSGKLR
jgi:(2Fe-2S) ferredoxin